MLSGADLQLRILYFALAVHLPVCLLTASSLGPCTIETIAGGGNPPIGDGGSALQAEFLDPSDVRQGPDGALYVASAHWRLC